MPCFFSRVKNYTFLSFPYQRQTAAYNCNPRTDHNPPHREPVCHRPKDRHSKGHGTIIHGTQKSNRPSLHIFSAQSLDSCCHLLVSRYVLFHHVTEDIVSRNPAYVLSVLALFYSPLGSKNSPHHARTVFAVFLLSNTNLFTSTIIRLTISRK